MGYSVVIARVYKRLGCLKIKSGKLRKNMCTHAGGVFPGVAREEKLIFLRDSKLLLEKFSPPPRGGG